MTNQGGMAKVEWFPFSTGVDSNRGRMHVVAFGEDVFVRDSRPRLLQERSARAFSVQLVRLARADEICDLGFSSSRSDDNCRGALGPLERQ
jgi:hypothetical protein